jgi:hypothetical protein
VPPLNSAVRRLPIVFAWLKSLLFPRIALELVSKHSLEESMRVLSHGMPQPPFAPSVIVNPKRTVTTKEVTLAVHHPFFSTSRNDFKACFVGAFCRNGSMVVLRGIYRYPYWVSISMLVWLVLTFLVGVGVLNPSAPTAERGVRFIAFAFFGFGLLLLLLGAWKFRRDVTWLNNYLKELLQ